MANRSYLYSTNLIPTHDNAGQLRTIIGLSESRYEMPLIYRALIAGTPSLCLSNIWQFRTEAGAKSESLAMIGNYADGLANLVFLQESVRHARVRPTLDVAVEFLSRSANIQPYLILEVAEYLSMLDDDDEPKGKLPVKVAAFCADHQGSPRESLAAVASRLNDLPDQPSALEDATSILGNCEWSNVLYQEPGPTGA